jgi:two-component system sensor histidine kinase AgrC
MFLNCFVEITCISTIIWFVLHYVMNVKFTKRFIIVPIVTFAICFYLLVGKFDEKYFFGTGILYLLLPVLLAKDFKKTVVLYTSLLTIVLSYFIFGFIYFIMNFFQIPIEEEAYCLTMIVSILLVIKLRNKTDILGIMKLLSTKIKVILLIYLWVLFCFYTFINDYLSYQPRELLLVYSFFLYLIIFGSGLLIFMLIRNIKKKSYYENLSNIMDVRLTEQVKHYEQVEKTDNELRKFRHNYKNMKIGLMSLLNNKDTDGAKKYVADCDELLDIDYTLYQTGNSIINAILSDKAMKVKDKGITIKFTGLIPQTKISNTDLCIIFGNILDNAIEAVEKVDDNIAKEINIDVYKKKDYLFITVTNPTKTEVAIKDNKIVTSKDDKSNHGLGLSSVEETLKKYDGHLDLDCDNNKFTTSFDFCVV